MNGKNGEFAGKGAVASIRAGFVHNTFLVGVNTVFRSSTIWPSTRISWTLISTCRVKPLLANPARLISNIGNDAPLNYWEFTEVVKKIVPGMQIELRPVTRPTAPAQRLHGQHPYQRRSGVSPRVHYRAGNHGIHRWLRRHPE
jgi:hypothetical protein